MSELSKVKKAMNGITEYIPNENDDESNFQNVSIRNYEVPSYIVANIFFEYLGFHNYGKLDKIWWHTFFSYKDYKFLIHDYKFGTWSLMCKDKATEAKKIIPEIVAKIKCASNSADKLLQDKFLENISNKKFWIKNNYHELMTLYTYYKKEVKSKIKYRNYTTEILYKTIPMIISFYSFLEFFLDVVFAFSNMQMSLKDFRNLIWQERFKLLIKVNQTQKITPIYDKLVNIKNNYRNPIMHGLGNESGLIVSSKYEGLVPISYKLYGKRIELSFFSFKEHNSVEIMETFDEFIHFIKRNKPYSFYVQYLESRFEIPVDSETIEQIKSKMTNKKNFNEYLERKKKYSDMIYNREI